MTEEADCKCLDVKECFYFPSDFDSIRLMIEWTSKQQGIICDLDVNVYCYDERARFIEKIDSFNKVSKDRSCYLVGKIESIDSQSSHVECLKVDVRLVNKSTSAILLYLDGGPRNFQFLQSVNVQCLRVMPDRSYGDFLPNENATNGKNGPAFSISGRTRKNYQGLALCALYKDGWNDSNDTPRWVAKSFLEPLFVTSVKEKLERCGQLVVNAVPALEKFRPRLFSSIKDICSALSSHALPKLKKKFQKSEEGLQIGQFTEVLFKQLYESHPRIVEDSEAAYTVAMLQEMFYQIDYNGDSTTNWDEFTTFCVQTGVTGLLGAGAGNGAGGSAFSLDQYVIEYGEEQLHRDHVLSAYRFVAQMRHVPETRRLLLVPEDSDNVMIFDEKFRLHSQLYPSKVQVIGNLSKGDINENKNWSSSSGGPRPMIYDCVFLAGRDLYAYTSSDHSIAIVREISSMGGRKINYLQYNRFFHTLLHLKLCWSAKHDLLCSVASDRTIYGWNIDTSKILFQISRHSDIVTDFVAVDHLDIFITCSMDKRIVLWSAVSRRVKGILLGHKRGVRCVSVFESTLLSAGFECEAKVWDLGSKDCVAVLKGHRHPICAAKLMCERAHSESEHRAITVDETGEFRLWSIYVRERSTDPTCVPTLQIFSMQTPESPINQFRFLALPYNPQSSTSYYSNLIACSTKLLHFLPEKNTKEFVPPGASVLSESASTLVTAVGRNLLTYDISTGQFSGAFENVAANDISALCLDGERGRRMFVGTGAGELLLVNSMSGAVIDQVQSHTKEVTAVVQAKKGPRNCVFSSSMDGSLRMYEEGLGKLHVHNSVDNAFGEGVGVLSLKVAGTLSTVVAASVGHVWGVWNDLSFKKLLLVHQPEIISAIEIVGASRDRSEEEHKASIAIPQTALFLMEKESLLTVAVAMTSKICVYTMDVVDMRGIRSCELVHGFDLYLNEIAVVRSPDVGSMNYSSVRTSSATSRKGSQQLVGVSDDGQVVVWDLEQLRFQSDARFRKAFKGVPVQPRNVPHPKQIKYAASASSSARSQAATKRAHLQQVRHQNQSRRSVNNGSDLHPGHKVHSQQNDVSCGRFRDRKMSSADSDDTSVSSSGTTVAERSLTLKQLSSAKSAARKMSHSLPSALAARNLQKKRQDAEEAPRSSLFLTDIDHQVRPTSASANVGGPGRDRRKSASKIPVGGGGSTDTSASWIELEAKHLFISVPGEKTACPIIRSSRSWVAHNDSISTLVPMNSNSCLLTVSHDGYHRAWNLEQECLGELVLPNITDHMKQQSRCQEPGSAWRFILERIPVTKHHVDISNVLVRSLRQTRQEKMMESQMLNSERRAHNNVPIGFKGFREAVTFDGGDSCSGNYEQEMLRAQVLQSLSEPPVTTIDQPPTRLPTKEEKELIRLSITMDKLSSMGGHNSNAKGVSSPNSLSVAGGGSLEIGEKGFSSTKLSSSIVSSDSPTRLSTANSGKPAIRSSAFFGGDSSVCMSAFGGPSLWTVPGEVDIFGKSVANKTNWPEKKVPPAFSEASLAGLQREGRVDNEGLQILRRLGMDAEKVQVYDRCLPTLLVRNASLSTSVTLPSLDAMRKTEIHFGAQKDMYKNAEKVLNEKDNLSKAQIRNSVALARIELNVRKVHSMIHLIQPPSHDEVILPKNMNGGDGGEDEMHKLRTEEQKMKIRLLKSAAMVPAEARAHMRPLNRESIDKWVSKMKSATELPGDGKYGAGKKKKKKEVLSQAAVHALEKQLQQAIRGEYRSRIAKVSKAPATTTNTPTATPAAVVSSTGSTPIGDPPGTCADLPGPSAAATDVKKALTTRALLPYYKLESVHQFMDIFAKVDENFSGDLDVNEWIKLFTSLNESVPVQEARMIFMKIDKDCDGYLTMRELVPVVFSKASKEQQRLIIAYAEMELTKKVEHESAPRMSSTDLEQLFEAYDTDNIGFVDVSLIKDRVRSMNLSEQALFFFMDNVSDLADDEMVNLVEFKRLFRIYSVR